MSGRGNGHGGRKCDRNDNDEVGVNRGGNERCCLEIFRERRLSVILELGRFRMLWYPSIRGISDSPATLFDKLIGVW